MKKLLTILIVMFLVSNTAFAGAFKADARTKRIPAGTVFKLEFLQPVSTFSGCEGDSFVATMKNELSTGSNVILPSGSVVRGSIERIKTAKRCSRGAVLYIDFDHIVTPTGRQLPLSLGFVGLPKVTYDGGIYNNKGYGEALKTNWNKCADITKVSTKYGLKAGESAPGIQILTCPICAIGGGVGGVGYLIGDSIIDLCRKGQEVLFTKGTVFQTRLTQPIDVPVN